MCDFYNEIEFIKNGYLNPCGDSWRFPWCIWELPGDEHGGSNIIGFISLLKIFFNEKFNSQLPISARKSQTFFILWFSPPPIFFRYFFAPILFMASFFRARTNLTPSDPRGQYSYFYLSFCSAARSLCLRFLNQFDT